MSRTLITGASAGLGLELARLFAADGRDLILTARSADRLEELAAALRADFEVEVLCAPADLASPGGVEQVLAAVAGHGLRVGVLVNNAGFGAYGPFLERDWDIYRQLIDLNVTSLVHLTRELLPGMVALATESAGSAPADPAGARGGTGSRPPVFGVMNVASTAAFQPGPLMAAYFASKAFVLSFSEALHEELRHTPVKVSAFCPGPTRTDFFTTGSMIPQGAVTEADLAEYRRRDARRMDPALAVRVGYEGFLAGKAIVIPGRWNRVQAWFATRLPRWFVRRLTMRLLTK